MTGTVKSWVELTPTSVVKNIPLALSIGQIISFLIVVCDGSKNFEKNFRIFFSEFFSKLQKSQTSTQGFVTLAESALARALWVQAFNPSDAGDFVFQGGELVAIGDAALFLTVVTLSAAVAVLQLNLLNLLPTQ